MNTQESAAPAAAAQPAGGVWLLTDNKPGHRTQLEGLLRALSERLRLQASWIDVTGINAGWRDLFTDRYTGPWPLGAAAPQIAIAAGVDSHRQLLALRRETGCFAVVLKRPSLPASRFDAVIVPRHEHPREHPRTFITEGTLSPAQPATAADPKSGLLQIGGPSRHFRFDGDAVVDDVYGLCTQLHDISWTLRTARTTPLDCVQRLRNLRLENLTLVSHVEATDSWMQLQLARCQHVWITADRVTRIYEALTAGACTGLLPLPATTPDGLESSYAKLQQEGMLNGLRAVCGGAEPHAPARQLDEAGRAADWLVGQLMQQGLL